MSTPLGFGSGRRLRAAGDWTSVNSAGASIQVSGNTGGGALTRNTAGTSCRLSGNTPAISGSANTVGQGQANTFNAAH
jgi:hypothetical protein